MKEYRLFEKIGDNCIAIDDTSEIINITKPDCIYDNADGWCKCFKCDKEFDLYDVKNADQFYEKHQLAFQINDFVIFKCKV